jgi:hypothetical protein
MLLPTIGEDPITAKPVDFESGDGHTRGGRELEISTMNARGVFTFPPPSADGRGKGLMFNGRESTGGREGREKKTGVIRKKMKQLFLKTHVQRGWRYSSSC